MKTEKNSEFSVSYIQWECFQEDKMKLNEASLPQCLWFIRLKGTVRMLEAVINEEHFEGIHASQTHLTQVHIYHLLPFLDSI